MHSQIASQVEFDEAIYSASTVEVAMTDYFLDDHITVLLFILKHHLLIDFLSRTLPAQFALLHPMRLISSSRFLPSLREYSFVPFKYQRMCLQAARCAIDGLSCETDSKLYVGSHLCCIK